VIERGKRFSGLVPRPIHGIDQQNILPSVVVVIEKANSAAHGLGKVLFSESPAIVFEADPRLRGHVREFDWARRTRLLSAGIRLRRTSLSCCRDRNRRQRGGSTRAFR